MKVINHWVKSLIGMEGYLTGEHTEYNNEIFLHFRASNNGPYMNTNGKERKVRCWKIGDLLKIRRKDLE